MDDSQAFSADGTRIALWESCSNVQIFNASIGHMEQELPISDNGKPHLVFSWVHSGPMEFPSTYDKSLGLVFSPGNTRIASFGDDGFVYIWNTSFGAVET
ncbi:hypothetical protein N7478_009080 [Penicillium angulare]|uniref:uncharacterized protein n=1 Tax=Penicillium angulare TaxID=116970 RepID=UPI002541C709|nr:uncharacterized protein N7478_009080 [Penicillium angulare]KAJ5273955.1 hypothetical protein N7478_009080 [Penicillium angulare]